MNLPAVRKGCATVRTTLQTIEMVIGVICLGVMVIMMLLNIFFRYVLYKPIYYSDELNNYLFIWMSFLSAAYIMGNDGHVRVTAVISLFSEKVRIWIKLVMDIVMIVVFSSYIWPSVRMLGRLKRSNMLRVPLKYVYMIMPIAFALISIHIIINIVDEFARLIELKNSTTEGE